MSDKTAILYRMVLPEHTCPFGVKAKHLLETKGYRVDDRVLTTRADVDAFKAEHNVATRRRPSSVASASAAMTICRPGSASSRPIRRRPAMSQ